MNKVVYGENAEPKKVAKMKLSESRYVKKKSPPNQWRELEISDDVLKDALRYILTIRKSIKKGEYIDKVIVGERADQSTFLSVAILKERGLD